ncbi:hypothetical protein GGH91_000801 [Coemansia sp. RSA 2671]|uniref:Uncharacterized protein n=1 Tax=Coemansia linderi TaxID=2663919 RepID=A0ACC1KBT2_9FUNG|nr:hypothetical protein LPJ60_002560 [Coemansia sp. RSA 2675]KAJ2349475.1 hypothetical protein GGH91_000801 [Coemansia sp. RSA 2671]KAJ2782686.1 hypothetical protein GGI18_003599 [Coemansia linderi]
MRFFVVLAALSCMLALCHAARKVTFNNWQGQQETYYSDDYHCHRVGRKFHSPQNWAAATGGPTAYYIDSECNVGTVIDPNGKGAFVQVSSPIKGYRAIKFGA